MTEEHRIKPENDFFEEFGGRPPGHVELLAAVRYWYYINLQSEWSRFRQAGIPPIDLRGLAARRAFRTAEILGEEAVRKIMRHVERELQREDPQTWRIFTEGTLEEADAYRERKWRERRGETEDELPF